MEVLQGGTFSLGHVVAWLVVVAIGTAAAVLFVTCGSMPYPSDVFRAE